MGYIAAPARSPASSDFHHLEPPFSLSFSTLPTFLLIIIHPSHIFMKFLSSSSSSFSSQNPVKIPAFSNLLKRGFSPSIRSLNLFLSFLLKARKIELLLQLFSQISSNSIQIDFRTHSLVARALLKARRFEEAEQFISRNKIFDFSSRKGLWDSLIRGVCVVGGDAERALSMLHECVKNRGIFPSPITFRLLVFSFSSQGKMDRAIEVLEAMTGEKIGYPFDNFVCTSIISGFCKIGEPRLGLSFYRRAEKIHDFQPNLMTLTAVVDAFCRDGRIDEACNLIRKMETSGMVLDAVLYSSWICGYFRKGALMEGLRKHRLMVENGIMPDVVSYTTIIDGLCKEGSVEKVVGFINEMEKSGKRANLITCTALIQGFCRRRRLEVAFCVLRKIEESGTMVDEFIYSVLIDGLCRKGDFDRVFSLLEEMERKGIEVGSVTYNTVINGLCKAGKTSMADEISRGFQGDNFTYSTLLHGYMKEMDIVGVMETKRRLEEADICMDVVTFNILIKALFMVGMVEDACVLFQSMPEKGVAANYVTYCTMIDGFCKLGMIDKAQGVFEEYRRTSLISDSSCHNCIIRGLCKECMVEKAIEVFLDLTERNLSVDSISYRRLVKAKFKEGDGKGVLEFVCRIEKLEPELLSSIFNDVVSFLCTEGCLAAALDAYVLMRRRGLSVTSKSFYFLLKCLIPGGNRLITELLMCDCIKVYGFFEPRMTNVLSLYLCKKNVEEAIQFLADTDKKDISISVLTAIIDALKDGRVEDAHKFLMEAEENGASLDVIAFSIVVDGLCKEGYLEKAVDLCVSMGKKGIHPNIVTYNSVINGLCQQGCLVEAFRLFDSLEPNGVLPTVTTYATLINALSRDGFLQDANHLFETMVLKGISPSTRIYNLLINGYCSFGTINKALKVLMDLEGSGLLPDPFTISSVIRGFCLKGDTEGALGFFNEYKVRGYSPDFLGFMNLIKGLSAKGRMEEARGILRDMLHCTAAVDLINRAGEELHVESLVSLLDLACEQGRIQEVIGVLSEVGSMTFFSRRTKKSSRLTQLKELHESGMTDYELLLRKSPCYDFDSFYAIVASLCLKGELQKANTAVKTMLLSSGETC